MIHTQTQTNPKMPTNTLITPREAAALLQVTPRTVARWCRDGRISAVKVSRVWRVRCFDGQPIIKAVD